MMDSTAKEKASDTGFASDLWLAHAMEAESGLTKTLHEQFCHFTRAIGKAVMLDSHAVQHCYENIC